MQRSSENALQAKLLGQRFQQVRSELGFSRQEDFASSFGRSRNSVSAYERGQSAPDGETLMRLAQLGINIQWLLTGEGAMLTADERAASAAPAETAAPLDENLLAAIADGIARVYKEENARLSEGDKGRLIARMHNDLVAAYDDPNDRKVAINGMVQQLRRDLRAKPAAADNSKRLA